MGPCPEPPSVLLPSATMVNPGASVTRPPRGTTCLPASRNHGACIGSKLDRWRCVGFGRLLRRADSMAASFRTRVLAKTSGDVTGVSWERVGGESWCQARARHTGSALRLLPQSTALSPQLGAASQAAYLEGAPQLCPACRALDHLPLREPSCRATCGMLRTMGCRAALQSSDFGPLPMGPRPRGQRVSCSPSGRRRH